jgi:hypothetical protein
MKVTVLIQNDYSDGHHSDCVVELDGPEESELIELWWADEVYPHTGDGHGTDSELGSCYTATIVAGDPRYVGKTAEWID